MTLAIIFEDNHLIAVNKPRGLPTQADASGDADLLTLVKGYLKEKYHKPGAVYLGLIHRLDRPVGGIVLFAKTSKAASRLSAQVRDGRFRKGYLAIVHGAPQPAEGRLEHWLVKDTNRNFVSIADDGTPEAKQALLGYRMLAARDGKALLAVMLITGRSHQIRVQLAAIGHPVVGDEKYGSKSGAAVSDLALHAAEIRCEHPIGKGPLSLTLPPAAEGPWLSFDSTLRSNIPIIS